MRKASQTSLNVHRSSPTCGHARLLSSSGIQGSPLSRLCAYVYRFVLQVKTECERHALCCTSDDQWWKLRANLQGDSLTLFRCVRGHLCLSYMMCCGLHMLIYWRELGLSCSPSLAVCMSGFCTSLSCAPAPSISYTNNQCHSASENYLILWGLHIAGTYHADTASHTQVSYARGE